MRLTIFLALFAFFNDSLVQKTVQQHHSATVTGIIDITKVPSSLIREGTRSTITFACPRFPSQITNCKYPNGSSLLNQNIELRNSRADWRFKAEENLPLGNYTCSCEDGSIVLFKYYYRTCSLNEMRNSGMTSDLWPRCFIIFSPSSTTTIAQHLTLEACHSIHGSVSDFYYCDEKSSPSLCHALFFRDEKTATGTNVQVSQGHSCNNDGGFKYYSLIFATSKGISTTNCNALLLSHGATLFKTRFSESQIYVENINDLKVCYVSPKIRPNVLAFLKVDLHISTTHFDAPQSNETQVIELPAGEEQFFDIDLIHNYTYHRAFELVSLVVKTHWRHPSQTVSLSNARFIIAGSRTITVKAVEPCGQIQHLTCEIQLPEGVFSVKFVWYLGDSSTLSTETEFCKTTYQPLVAGRYRCKVAIQYINAANNSEGKNIYQIPGEGSFLLTEDCMDPWLLEKGARILLKAQNDNKRTLLKHVSIVTCSVVCTMLFAALFVYLALRTNFCDRLLGALSGTKSRHTSSTNSRSVPLK